MWKCRNVEMQMKTLTSKCRLSKKLILTVRRYSTHMNNLYSVDFTSLYVVVRFEIFVRLKCDIL